LFDTASAYESIVERFINKDSPSKTAPPERSIVVSKCRRRRRFIASGFSTMDYIQDFSRYVANPWNLETDQKTRRGNSSRRGSRRPRRRRGSGSR